ncbi:MAG: hypothetical protein ABW002_10105, partial [Xanthomonas sp.]
MEQRNGKQTAAWPQQRARAQGPRHVLHVRDRQDTGQGTGQIHPQAGNDGAQDHSGRRRWRQGGAEGDAGAGNRVDRGACLGTAR